MPPHPAFARLSSRLAVAAVCTAVAACASHRVTIEAQESFDSAATYSRTYAAPDAQTCEAARRALLSQGYVIEAATADQVRGRKSFQPGSEAHADVEFTVVCAKTGENGSRTIAFANAVQENYTVRKSNNSASVGVAPFGSLSLPFTGSEESLVKVGSATITSAPFYERFFRQVERYLGSDRGPGEAPVPVLPAASSASGLAAPATGR